MSLALLAGNVWADDQQWPDEPPLPVQKPALRLALAEAGTLQLDFLPLAPATFAKPTMQATVVLESAPASPVRAEAASVAARPSLVRKAAPEVPTANQEGVSKTESGVVLAIEPLLRQSFAQSLASIEASAAAGSLSERLPFAAPAPPLAISLGSNALRFQLAESGNLSIAPSLEVIGGPRGADPNFSRVVTPQNPRLTPSPGIDAVMQLGDITLDAKLSQPLRAVETRDSPDTRALSDRSNIGVDMKLKF